MILSPCHCPECGASLPADAPRGACPRCLLLRGFEVWGTNTDLDGYVPGRLEGEVTVRLACPALRLAPGEYGVDVAVHSRAGAPYDYQRRALAFTVTAGTGGVGVYFPEHRWEFGAGIRWKE